MILVVVVVGDGGVFWRLLHNTEYCVAIDRFGKEFYGLSDNTCWLKLLLTYDETA
jgi:hypothetical protein